MIQKIKKGLVFLQELAVIHGVKFFFLSGANGGGKDLQGALAEELLLHHGMYAHVGTSDAIRHHMNEESELGESLRMAKENEARGILFPDRPTIEAIAEDIRPLHKKGFKKFLLSGFPRGYHQPFVAISISQSHIINYDVSLETSLRRAAERTEMRRLRGEAQRVDDKPETVYNRFKDHEDTTAKRLRALKSTVPGRVTFIDGEQPVGHVLRQTFMAMSLNEDVIRECLHNFETRSTDRIKELMAHIDGAKKAKPVQTITKPESIPTTKTPTPIVADSKWGVYLLGTSHRQAFWPTTVVRV